MLADRVLGQRGSCPKTSVPAETVSRLVPSTAELLLDQRLAGGGDADHRDHRGDADGDAQRGEHRPHAGGRAARGSPSASRSPGARAWSACSWRSCGLPRCVGDDPSVADAHLARHPLGQLVVVGDDNDGGARALSSRRIVHDPGAGGVSRLPVGSSARSSRGFADHGPGDRHALAFAAGELARVVPQPVAEPHALERDRRPGAGARAAGSPCRAARWPRCRAALTPSERWNCWKTNPIVWARSAESSRVVQRRRRRGRRCGLAGGRRSREPMMLSIVDLPEPDGPDDGEHLALLDAQVDAGQCGGGRGTVGALPHRAVR